MNDIEIFTANVRYLRKKHGLTQKEMAAKLGISVYSIAKMEKGELPERLNSAVLFAIHHHFGLPPAKQFEKQWDFSIIESTLD